MEKVIIQYASRVEQYLDDLVKILFDEEYFSYEESAVEYVQSIDNAIKVAISTKKPKQTPHALRFYGKFYISYKTNKRTAWYIFFSRKGNRVVVKHITNNHVADAGFLKHF